MAMGAIGDGGRNTRADGLVKLEYSMQPLRQPSFFWLILPIWAAEGNGGGD